MSKSLVVSHHSQQLSEIAGACARYADALAVEPTAQPLALNESTCTFGSALAVFYSNTVDGRGNSIYAGALGDKVARVGLFVNLSREHLKEALSGAITSVSVSARLMTQIETERQITVRIARWAAEKFNYLATCC